MKLNKKLMKKLLVIFTTLLVVGANVSSPALAIGTLDTITSQEKSNDSTEQKESTVKADSKKKVEKVSEPIERQSSEKVLDEVSKGNDSPKNNDNKKRSAEELSKRDDPLDVKGLSDEEIIELAQYLYGEYAQENPSFNLKVKNEKGDTLEIPFMRSRAAAKETVMGITFNWEVELNGYWGAYGTKFSKYEINNLLAYCVQPFVPFNAGEGFVQTEATKFTGITNAQKIRVNDLINFGARKGNADAEIAATQLYIWESLGYNVKTNLGGYASYKTAVNNRIKDFQQRPSFHNQTINIKEGQTIKVTDTANKLSNFKVQNANGSTVKIVGNTLEITATSSSKNGNIILHRNSFFSGNQYFWVKPNSQVVSTAGGTDPTIGFLKLNVTKNGNVTVRKVDEETKAPLQATFKATRLDTKEVKEIKTNANGYADWYGLPSGTIVQYEEIVAPTGYVINREPIKVTVKESQTVVQEFTNKIIVGSVKLIKYGDKEIGSEKTNVLLKGAEFTLYDSNNKEVKKLVTDDKGEAFFTNLPYGDYVLKETVAPSGYEKVADIPIQIRENSKVIEIKATDKLKTEEMEILKIDVDSKKPLANTTFKYSYGSVSNQVTTGADGKASIKTIPHGTKVKVEEVKAPTGYTLKSSPQEKVINSGEPLTFTFTNKKIIGSVKLIKLADKEMGTEKTNTRLKGAEFTIYDAAGKEVQKLATNENGEILFKDLEYGEYVIKETKVPVGYEKVADIPISIVEDGKVIEVTAIDKIKYEDLEILKIDVDTKKPLPNVTFKYSYGSTTKEVKTDNSGKIKIPSIPHGTKVTVKEVIAHTGYVLNEKPQEVVIESGKPVTLTFTNKKIIGSILLTKLADENWENGSISNPLSGAEFSLYAPDGKTLLSRTTTNEDGEILFSNLEYGFGYIIKETKTPHGYLPVSDMKVDITKDGEVIKIAATDKVIREDAKIIKVDDESALNIISKDAKFEITNLQTNKKVTRTHELGMETSIFVTNEKGEILIPSLPFGKYKIEEVFAPLGYIVLEKPVFFDVNGENNKLIEITIGNKLAKGQVTLTKTGQKAISSEIEETDFGNLHHLNFNQELLADVTFELYARNDIVTGDGKVQHKKGDLVGTYTTNHDGEFESDLMYIGDYFAKEKSAPNGFIINEEEIDFTINYEGQNVALTSTSIKVENAWNEVLINVNKSEEKFDSYTDNKLVVSEIPSETMVFGLYTDEAYYYQEKEIVPKDALVGIATTTEGIAAFSGQYPAINYYAKELYSGENHVIKEKKYPVSLVPVDNRDKVNVEVFEDESLLIDESTDISNYKPILNELFKTDVPFEKINEVETLDVENGYKYEFSQKGKDAEFELRNEENEVIQTVKIDESGIGVWKDLIVGTYFFNETKPSNEKLILNDTIYRIEVTQESTKIFEDFSDKLVYDSAPKEESEEESKEETKEESDVKTRAALDESKEESKEESKIEPFITIKNELKRGEIVINKIDLNTEKPLADAEFILRESTKERFEAAQGKDKAKDKNDKDKKDNKVKDEGKVVYRAKSDKDGIIKFENVPVGYYEIVETNAPTGYVIDKQPVFVEVKKNKDVVNQVISNVKETEKLRQTKASQLTQPLYIALLLTVMSLIILGYIAYRRANYV